jgi:uncharacterized protein (UPF0335 family)
MHTDIAQTIYEIVKGMPVEKQREILRKVEEIDQGKKNIWDKLEDLMKDVPDEEFALLPADASENIDHYLYGAPKK